MTADPMKAMTPDERRGREANLAGEPFDTTETKDWKRGWEEVEFNPPERCPTLQGLVRWHEHQAGFCEGGVFIEGARLAVTPTKYRKERKDLRRLIACLERDAVFHRAAAQSIRAALHLVANDA